MKTLCPCTVNSDKDVLNVFMHDIEVSEIIIFFNSYVEIRNV